MGFVDDETDDIAHHQHLLDSARTQHFGGDVEDRGGTVGYAAEGIGSLDRTEKAVDGHGSGYAGILEIVDLVLHE